MSSQRSEKNRGKQILSTKDMAGTKLVVSSIDIGTKFSGYAYSFRDDFINNPLKISTNEWHAEGVTWSYQKAPTTILLTKDARYHSFGFEAEDKYAELSESEQHNGWYYFHRFKMRLIDKDIRRDMEIMDINGRKQPAKRIFSLMIGALRNHLLDAFRIKGLKFSDSDIYWIVTVPAIWSTSAKQFMREACNEAGIKDFQLSLAYEPEAAALYCLLLPPEKLYGADFAGERKNIFKPGQKLMVIDLGGGTADVTVQAITEGKQLKQIYRSNGGAWGGTKVDDDFYQFLVKIFGNDILVKFSQSHMSEYLQLFRYFEIKKCKVSPNDTKEMIIQLPLDLVELLQKESGCTIQELILQSQFHKSVSIRKDKLKICPEIYKECFQKALKDIKEHLQKIISNCCDIKFMLMVGGFSESPMVIDMIRTNFPNIVSIVPPDAKMSVLLGSVIYGHNPEQINARVCEYSYGIAVHKEFIQGAHAEDKSFYSDGKKRVDDCFEKLFTINEIMNPWEKRSFPVYNTHIDDDRQQWRWEHKEIEIYASTDSDPKYITHDSCFKLGTILVPVPDGGWPESMKGRIEMSVGGTEIKVSYHDYVTNQKISTKIDCFKNV